MRRSVLSISQNDVLFQLLGTTYGGDGDETFGLPDLTAAAPPNLHYCISLFGEFGTSTYTYNAIIGETMVAVPSLVARNLLQENTALYDLIGTTFGGSGTTFAIPNLTAPTGYTYYLAYLQAIFPPRG